MNDRNEMKRAVAAALFKEDYGEPWEEATETARWQWLAMADVAIRAMDRTEAMALLHTLASLLDGVLPLLEKEAALEAKAEVGKPMRRVTQQKRLETARQSIDRAFTMLGIEP